MFMSLTIWTHGREAAPKFVSPMMAETTKAPFGSPDWIFEVKLDGFRAIAVFDDAGKPHPWSRNRLPLEKKLPAVAKPVSNLIPRSTILDGEIDAVDENGIPRFQLLQRFQKQPTAPTLYYVFDVLWSDGQDVTGKTVLQRRGILEKIIKPVAGIQLGSYVERDPLGLLTAKNGHFCPVFELWYTALRFAGSEPIKAHVMTFEKIGERLGELQPHLFALLKNFVVWNDLMRYPDMPPGPREAYHRSRINEFQLRYLAGSKEQSIIVGAHAILYDTMRRSPPNLLKLAREIKNFGPSNAVEIDDALTFLEDKELSDPFCVQLDKWLAHIDSLTFTEPDVIKAVPIFSHVYNVVPKTIYLSELLHSQFHSYLLYNDNKFKTLGNEIAAHFHHSAPDALLADLFSSRPLPSAEFKTEVKQFLVEYRKRQDKSRSGAS
jgi:hypothetical protein